MFLDFFLKLKDSRIPVSLNEFLVFLKALESNFVQYEVNKFYYLARTCLVKDEKLIDKFDIVFISENKIKTKLKRNRFDCCAAAFAAAPCFTTILKQIWQDMKR